MLFCIIIVIDFLLILAGWMTILRGNVWSVRLIGWLAPHHQVMMTRILTSLAWILTLGCVIMMTWICRRRALQEKAKEKEALEEAKLEDQLPTDDGPIIKVVRDRCAIWLISIMLCFVVLMTLIECWGLTHGAPTQEYAVEAKHIQMEINELAKVLFDEAPPTEEQVRAIVAFPGNEQSFISNMHARFPALEGFHYSLLGMLLRSHRERMTMLQGKYLLAMTWYYPNHDDHPYIIPYVMVTPVDPQGHQTGKIIFAIEPISGRLVLEGSSIDGEAFYDILQLTRPDGKFTRKQHEDEFWKEVLQPLMTNSANGG